jgi:predicted HicB family RNase H-like nuclease
MESTEQPRKRGRPPTTGITPQRQVRIPDAEWEAYNKLAEKAGLTISEWIRRVLRRAARRGRE